MAKCIKLSNGQVVRTSDSVAKREVIAGRATYITKSVWRQAGRQRG